MMPVTGVTMAWISFAATAFGLHCIRYLQVGIFRTARMQNFAPILRKKYCVIEGKTYTFFTVGYFNIKEFIAIDIVLYAFAMTI